MASMIRKQISAEVKVEEYSAIFVDETKDISKREQFSEAVRYLYDSDIYESFPGFTAADGSDAESPSKNKADTLNL